MSNCRGCELRSSWSGVWACSSFFRTVRAKNMGQFKYQTQTLTAYNWVAGGRVNRSGTVFYFLQAGEILQICDFWEYKHQRKRGFEGHKSSFLWNLARFDSTKYSCDTRSWKMKHQNSVSTLRAFKVWKVWTNKNSDQNGNFWIYILLR